ncbi:MAG: pilus assembly FimT family protein [Planctomycetota bacterium]|jgi:prepilin-type N-terminal cleavage/methylation domain-containing protein
MKRWGFTIPEMLLVVLIIGLITSAGTGLYVGTFRGMQIRKAALDFLLTARYARLMALERQTRCTMELDMANHAFSLTMLRRDEASQEMTLETVRDMYCKPVQFEGDVQFEAVEVVPGVWETQTDGEQQKTIVFSPNGTAEEAVVQIGNGRTHYTISINAATSRAKMYFGTAENVEVTTTDLDAER